MLFKFVVMLESSRTPLVYKLAITLVQKGHTLAVECLVWALPTQKFRQDEKITNLYFLCGLVVWLAIDIGPHTYLVFWAFGIIHEC